MKARQLIGKVLLVLAVPLVFLGLIDPLEGGLALILATVIYAVAFWLLRAAPSRWLWIPFLVSLVVGIATIVLAIFQIGDQPQGSLPPPLIIGLWLYRLSVVAALLGAAVTLKRALFPARAN